MGYVDRNCHRRGGRCLKRVAFIDLGSNARGTVAAAPVDARKGADVLAALGRAQYGGDPFSRLVYVFRAKKADELSWSGGTPQA